MSVFNELKRRNVFKVAIAYVVVAWLVIQVADVILSNIVAPGWVFLALLLFLAVGFLFAIIFSWVYEMTPEGLRREHEVEHSQSITHHTGKKLSLMIKVLLLMALGYFAFDKFVLSRSPEAMHANPAADQAPNQAEAAQEEPVKRDNTIAVLPFINMSSDQEQEYFSDGLSEELLNLLAKIPELRVTSRSSAFAFKGEKIDIPTVARKLNVANILEGSVRKSGDQVRVTAQLIEAGTDTHLWSETYDRTLDDVFAIQDEIASAVVTKLKITLLGEVPTIHETDPRAYALYLQGRHLRRQRTVESVMQAEKLYQQALVFDPGYAAVWDDLGAVYMYQGNLGLRAQEEGYKLAREATNNALANQPDYALAHASLAYIARSYDNDLASAARHLQRALQLEPANIGIVGTAALLTASLGRLDEAIKLNEFAVIRDPVSPSSHSNLGLNYTSAGRWDEAIASLRTTLTLSPGYGGAHYKIGIALLLKGEPQAALEAIQQEDSVWRMIGLPVVYHALGRKQESDAALAALIEQHEQGWAYNIAYVMAWRGEADRAFEWLNKAVQYKDGGLSEILGEQLFSNIHNDPRWQRFLHRVGYSPEQLASIQLEIVLPES